MKKLFLALFLVFQMSWSLADQTKLKLPWDVLEKILKLNQDSVRLKWEEFQILLAHTSPKKIPKYSTSNGEVVLTKEEFHRLVDSLLPPTPEAPASLLTSASYKSRLKNNSVVIDATLQIHLRNKAGKYLRVDLFPAGASFHEILLDGKNALVEQDGGRLYLTTNENGAHVANLKFSVKIPEEKGRQSVSFSIPQTPITIYELEIPNGKMDVFVNQALSLSRQKSDEGTRIKAILSPTTAINASWNPEVASEKKGPAQIYSDFNHLLSIEDDAIRVYSVLSLQVLKNSVNSLEIKIPNGFNVIDIKGDGVGDWTEKGTDEKVVRIPFEHAVTGFYALRLTTEQILTENKISSPFSGLYVNGAIREKGFLGVELRTSAEAQLGKDLGGLERIDIQELPSNLVSASERPLLFGFRYLRPPYSLSLEVERHPDVQLLSSVIDNASGVSWLNEDGKLMHQITYRLRNMGKQFLEVQLPKESQLWSVFVEGLPAKPSEGTNGKLLVPLNRSQNTGRGLSSFDVEITYLEDGFKTFILGRHTMQFPVPDMMMSRLNWTFYLPKDHMYRYFGRDLDVQEDTHHMTDHLSRLDGPLTSLASIARREKKADIRSNSSNLNEKRPEEEGDVVSDKEFVGDKKRLLANNELIDELGSADAAKPSSVEPMLPQKSFARDVMSGTAALFKRERVAGVLPIRVHLPVMGVELRFTKALVLKDAPVQISLYYFSDFLVVIIKIIFLALLGWVGYRHRKNISAYFSSLTNKYAKQVGRFKPKVTPFGWVVLSMVGCLLISHASWYWVGLFVVIFLIAVARWVLNLVHVSQGGMS